jgi:imidazolonepropionase-like amidohydrolase
MRTGCIVQSLILLVLPAVLGDAQNAQTASPERLVIHAERLLDVVAGSIVLNPYVVVAAGKIVSVSTTRPANARIVELGATTLLPGLIDVHTHLTFDLQADWMHLPVQETPVDAALRGVRAARATLDAGFTTVRDLGSFGFADVSLMKAVERGDIQGPRIVPVGHAISITGGHCDVTGFIAGVLELGPAQGIADGASEILKAVRYQVKHGAKAIKVCATAGVLSFEGPVGAQQYSAEELTVLVQEASRHGLRVAAHAHGTDGIVAAVRAGVMSVEHGSMLNEEAVRLMKEKDIWFVPNPYIEEAVDSSKLPPALRAKSESLRPAFEKSMRMAIAAKLKFAFGTDAGVIPHGANARQFASLVKWGLTPTEAIRTATVNAAELLGLEDRGVIAAGKTADMIAVPGNPLLDIKVLEQVGFVMQGGVIVKGFRP